jgi:hypothetical protein
VKINTFRSPAEQTEENSSQCTSSHGSRQDSDLYMVLDDWITEGEEADEQAHREADPAKKGNSD